MDDFLAARTHEEINDTKQISYDLKIIHLFINFSKEKVYFIAKHTHLYDFDDKIKANGYRTHVKIFEKIIDDITLCLNKYKENYQSVFGGMYISTYKKRLQCWSKFIIAFYPIFCAAAKLIQISPNSLFADKNHCINKIFFDHAASFVNEIFYGELFAFQFLNKLNIILNVIASSMAAYAMGYDTSSSKILQTVIAFSKNGYFFLNPKKRSPKLKQIYSMPTIDFCKSFMSLHENYGLHHIPSLIGPNLHINRAVKLKVKELTLESRINKETIILFDSLSPYRNLLGNSIDTHFMSWCMYEGQCESFKTAVTPIFQCQPDSEYLVIFIHGGGFVALSSKSCEMFLRQWAVLIHCPFISIDYTLSPKAVFPQAIEECFYVYCWILCHSIKIGSRANKIVLIGDSAGANLILAVTNRAITEGIRIPDGLVCVYPLCNMTATVSPSRILSNIDSFLSSGFLFAAKTAYFSKPMEDELIENHYKTNQSRIKSCTIVNKNTHCVPIRNFHKLLDMHHDSLPYYPQSDLKENENDENNFTSWGVYATSQEDLPKDISEDPLASPLLTDSDILKQYPPTRFILTDTDPLLDDGIEFAKKLSQNAVDVKVDVLSDLPHGFLQFCYAANETQVACDIVVARLKELLYKN
ncbi:hypothetical protein HZS_7312 [Henneguya salminicola]|nr:hypothetical protein HZS_7312 [Henneguya salminicola]